MNRRLVVLAVAAVAAGSAAVPAHAAKAVCLQIQDVTGDGTLQGQVPDAQDALDIVSADIASGTRNVVATIRLKSVSAQPGGTGSGVGYFFYFTVGGVGYKLTHYTDVTGQTSGGVIANGAPAVPVDTALDPATGTVTWTLPRKAVAGLKKPGAKLTGLSVESARAIVLPMPNGGSSRTSTPNDTASTGRSYTDGTATCLRGT